MNNMSPLRMSRILGALLLLLPLSCGSQGDSGGSSHPQTQAELLRALASSLDRFPGLGIQLLPERISLGSKEKESIEAFSSRDAGIQDVLSALFKDSGINLLIEGDVQGTATFDIKKSTLEESFLSLLRAYDLGYSWDGTFLRILPKIHRIFDVDFPSEETARSNGLQGGNGSAQGSSETSGDSGGGTGSVKFWDVLKKNFAEILAKDKDASLVVNERLGSISVEGKPSTVERIGSYLEAVRRRSTKQVSIEARILEVKLNRDYKTGVDYSLLPGFFNFHHPSNRGGTLTDGAILRQSAQAGVDTLNIGFLNAGQFSIFIDALSKQGQVRVLSSPRVSTLNNVPAVIRVVEQVPVIEREIIDSGTGTSRTQFNVRFEDAGVAVSVTPQIGEDGIITAVVAPSIIEVSGFVSTPDNLITEPILNTRKVTTTLRIPDGVPVVLGGLRSRRKSETLTGVPLLSDIPILGALFRTTIQEHVETELVILLFPRILTPAWMNEDVQRGVDRVLRTRVDFKAGTAGLGEGEESEWHEPHLGGRAGPGKNFGDRPARVQIAEASAKGISKAGLGRLALARAVANFEKGNDSQGWLDLNEALSLDPHSKQAWLLDGIMEGRRQRLRAARKAFREVVRLDPGDVYGLNNLGLIELRLGNPVVAEGRFRRALAKADMPELRNNLGIALLGQGKTHEAAEQFAKAIEAMPGLAEAQLNLAVCKDRQGDPQGAAKSYRAFLLAGGDPADPRLRPLKDHLQALGVLQ
ncbi:MAG TPA: tetratricopeptide repeat protein [Planctomycetes bacterium]|nr:tetratricopeptide repeat protein [Planctomycetota bacterium]